MTDFWQGFITAIALIAVSIIVAALVSYRRQERKRQVMLSPLASEFLSTIMAQPAEKPANPQGKKGIH